MKLNLNDEYQTLLKKYGPQGWWPAESALEIMIGAILTQNTSWQNVERAISNLKPYLSEKTLLEIPLEKLKNLIRPAGFYNQKANYIKALLNFLQKYQFDYEKIKKQDLQEFKTQLLLVKGIGQETCDSIMLYVFGLKCFVVDTYLKRFLKKFGISFKTDDEYQQFMHENFQGDTNDYMEFHALIVRSGKDH